MGNLQTENAALHSRTSILEKVLDMRNEQIQVMQESKEVSWERQQRREERRGEQDKSSGERREQQQQQGQGVGCCRRLGCNGFCSCLINACGRTTPIWLRGHVQTRLNLNLNT